MNDKGFFYYLDYPQNAIGSVDIQNITKQTAAQDIEVSDAPIGCERWATFEEGEFDFNKPIYTAQEGEKIAFTSTAVSNGYGWFSSNPTITLTPPSGVSYSGGGFSIATYMDSYELRITVSDTDGTRSRDYVKGVNDDEFFPFAYNGLISVAFEFKEIPPYHFINILSVDFGGQRVLDDKDFVENPEIVTYFSHTSEELSVDTLSFRVRGDKEDFNFIAGERIIYLYSSTKKSFYVNSAEYNNDGTISVEAYDSMSLLFDDFDGTMANNTAVSSAALLSSILGNQQYNIVSTLAENQTFSGTLSSGIEKREALRLLLQGNGLAVQRVNDTFRIFATLQMSSDTKWFTNSNICSAPTFEVRQKVTRVHFSKHNYKININETSDANIATLTGRQLIVQDNFAIGDDEKKVSHSDPYGEKMFYWVEKSGDDEILHPMLDSTKFAVVYNASYSSGFINKYYSNEIALYGYPYAVSYTSIDIYPDGREQFRKNEVMISDCTVCTDNVTMMEYSLEHLYSFDKKITFDSLLEADAGDIAVISYDGRQLLGWITKKTDNLTGIYSYEVMCRWHS